MATAIDWISCTNADGCEFHLDLKEVCVLQFYPAGSGEVTLRNGQKITLPGSVCSEIKRLLGMTERSVEVKA